LISISLIKFISKLSNQLIKKMPGIYIHIPYCRQACHYCDFHFSTVMKSKDDFVGALLKEIELQKDYLSSEPISSIYFGGGTPSLLVLDELKSILNQIKKYHTINSNAEITLEANPDDLTKGKLEQLKEAGINRLSIGIQSFADEELKWMNRAHTTEQALQCIGEAKKTGFKNISIDLIYGSPALTDEQWQKNLNITSQLNVQHLSCYALTVEPRTTLAKWIAAKQTPPIDEHRQAEHFDMLMDWAEQNHFEQYEISNFAYSQNYSCHNSSYWSGEKYLGLGPSAHSFNGTSRQWNVGNNYEYIQDIKEDRIPFEIETLSNNQQFNEYIMTGLRTAQGCNIETIRSRFGLEQAEKFFRHAMKFVSDGLMEHNRQNLILTRGGKFFADRIASELFIV
jgi:putative oxygen-independent coproporphyrinogen III oxidase